tara:strand:- start:740 stop:997 length:258 start_codon:yes stop_codon:yes gene_type:complete
MATQTTFVIEYGLSVGATEVINSSGKVIASALSSIDTDDISEGSNKYFSNTLARSAISLASGESNLSYNSTSGELSLPTVNGGTF